MIAAWLIYAVTISALLAGAAFVAEAALRLAKLPTRGAWVIALGASIALPLLAPSLQSSSDQASATRIRASHERALLDVVGRAPMSKAAPFTLIDVDDDISPPSPVFSDERLLTGWVALSLVLAGFGIASTVAMRRRLRRSQSATLLGTPVRVTRGLGPAVFGLWRPRIYVPQWLFDADATTQAIVMDHEHEHLSARDPQLLTAALLLLIVLPWNLPLWWQVRRLRFAIEVDCDGRVLKRGRDVSAYGEVMLSTAVRSTASALAMASLSEPTSFLERRIRLMKTNRRRWLLPAAALLGTSAAFLAAAASITAPETPLTRTASVDATGSERLLIPSPISDMRRQDAMLAAAVRYLYPQLAQARQSGTPHVWALVNGEGEVLKAELEFRTFNPANPAALDATAELTRHFGDHDMAGATYLVGLNPGTVGPDRVIVGWMERSQDASSDPLAPRFPVPHRNDLAAAAVAKLAAERAAIQRFDPDALERGVPAGQELWFLMDADGQVLKAGRRARITDPEIARVDLQLRFPGIDVGYVLRGTGVKDKRGRRIDASWSWLSSSSALPQ